MYAWLWRHLPGTWPAKAGIAVAIVAVLAAVLWWGVFPWLEPKVQLDHGVVDGTPSPTSTARPG
ncbi:hypothetical protein [Actinomadura opuntiae]|uniref:hypothetical protein n=1 Tax=Actinomadura sp. OS1-43 TaxID=604315 RepID=UPI00255AAA52|nr:hypothetical protein [Actinomadura sp. OS1-43]MDL4816760.1 hypothetical protein [Actinomadura sp. OS1-43]